MTPSPCEPVDPRIRRTRVLLQQALEKLLEKKSFDKISVQDIVEAATINRATFYDHYTDKFALLDCLVANRFNELLAERGVAIEGPCGSALKTLVVGLCVYLDRMIGPEQDRRIEPHMEQAMISVLRRMLNEGFQKHAAAGAADTDIVAAAMSGAIFGAAREWARTPGRSQPEILADTVLMLVSPMFSSLQLVEPAAH